MTPIEKERAARLVSVGVKYSEAAEVLETSADELMKLRRDPSFMLAVEKFRRETITQERLTLAGAAGRATQRIIELLESEDERVVLQSAKMVHDRVFADDAPNAEAAAASEWQSVKAVLMSVLEKFPEVKASFVEELKKLRAP